MKNRRPFIVLFILVLYGAMSLTSTLSRPRLDGVRAVDIVSLEASGACFGAALVVLVLKLRKRI